jgi:uroporphyrinogen decarboxylase
MTSRQRVLKSLDHQDPGMFPIDFGGVHTSIHELAYRNLVSYYGYESERPRIQEPLQQIVYPAQRILDRFGSDVTGVYTRPASSWKPHFDPSRDELRDEWGTVYVRPPGGFFYDISDCVMKNFGESDLDAYEWPDPTNKGRVEGLREQIERLRAQTNYAIMLFAPSWGLWESLWLLRGFENAYVDMGINLGFVEKLWERLLSWNQQFWQATLQCIGDLVDVVQIGDDLGSQRGPMFDPKLYRSMLKPLHTRLISCIKKNTQAKVYFHSCGDVSWAIPDLIESGVDILNPVQVSADNMDPRTLKREFGDKISFWGGGCDPRILLSGTVEDIKREVCRRIDQLAPGGGFVFASIHNVQANTPPQNVAAMFETAANCRGQM